MSKIHELLQKKAKEQSKPLGGPEKDAKLRAVKEMRKMASDEMSGPLKSLKKVTVASDSPQGLEHGLDKAKEIMHGGEQDEQDPDMEHLEEETGEDLDHDNEEGEPAEHAEKVLGHEAEPEHGDEDDDLSPEEIQAKIAELEALLKAKK